MTRTDATSFLEGKAFAQWQKGREAEAKMQAGLAERLNGVIRACGSIVKAVQRRS
ncbi:MAG: hypothetical protein ACRCYV_07245 [Aeromonas sp.]